MTTDDRFTRAFVGYLAGNKGSEGQPAEYGISARGDESTGSIELTLVFKKGLRYCCSEWTCHIGGVPRPGGWDELRRCLSESGINPSAKIELRLKVMIEEGAVIIVNKCFGGPLESSYQEYDETLREGAEACDQTHERPAEYTGKWTTYWENGQKYSECSYVNGQLQGKSTQWNSRGQKLMECDYKDGQRHGALTKWNGEGEIIDVSEWENGTGTYRIYYASGVLSSEHQMRHGKPHGVTREWNGRGEMTCTEHYEDGKLIHREGTPRWHHQCAFQRWSAETQCFPT